MTHAPPAPLRRGLAELIGTALLTLASLWADRLAEAGVLSHTAAFTLAPALTVLALIYTLSDVSGAHFNPAVTFAFALRGSFPWRLVPLYVLAQLAGAFVGAGVILATRGLPHPTEHLAPGGALSLEAACALLLVLVILGTAGRKATVAPTIGLVVGAALALDHFLADGVSPVTMNPARFLAPAVLAGELDRSWPHLLGPLLGAALAVGLTFLLRGPLNTQEREAATGQQHRTAS